MRSGSAPCLRRRGCIETLETRCVFAAPGTAVGDALFTLYDGAVVSTLPTDFSRDVATVNGVGEAVGIDERRFGETINYSPVTHWTEAPVTLSASGSQFVVGSGWDHDGETPLLLHLDQTFNRLTFYRGEGFEIANVRQFNNNDLMRGAIPGERFAPRAAIVHHGLVVIATARSVLVDGVYKIVGVDFFATQDYGVTMQRIPVAGGGYGVPVLEEAIGIDRLQTWSFLNPFPVDGIDDTNAAWFPWTDYLYKAGSPKGGQVGLFRADRAEGSDHWVISPNRVVYSQWIDEDTGGLHAHTAAVTTGGLITHWGDVGYRNMTMFHKFDLSNYETAPVESQVVYGGYSPNTSAYKLAPQPVAAAPSPVPGEHFAGGDETPDHVLSFGALSDFSERLDVESVIYQPEIDTPGGVHGGAAVLHLHWVQGVGYVAAAVQDNNYYFSPDGERWIEFNRPPNNVKASAWLYGDRLLAESLGKLWLADLPAIEAVRPLQIAPGGANELPIDPLWRRNPAATNTVRRVIYTEGIWRYEDTQDPLATQPPAPPFGSATTVYEVTVNGSSQDLGSLWLQPPGGNSSANDAHAIEMWIANLGEQGVSFGANQGVVGASGSRFGATAFYEINDNVGWVPVGVSAGINGDNTGRMASDWKTYYSTPGAKFLVATPYFGEGLSPTYPLAPQTSGADEVEVIELPNLLQTWSVGLVAQWPDTARMIDDGRMPIVSLLGEGGDALEIAIKYERNRLDVEYTFYKNGTQALYYVRSISQPSALKRGDWMELVITGGEQGVLLTFSISGEAVMQATPFSPPSLSLKGVVWADRFSDVQTAVNPILVKVVGTAWDKNDHDHWLKSALTEKALYDSFASPGDFNRDGVVDLLDYNLWYDTLADATPGRPGDLNSDGLINESDRLIWTEQYGMTGSGLTADLNADGVVDAADYTVWRDLTAPQVAPGTGADADRNGFVELADLQYWTDAYGAVYPTFESLRAAYFAEADSDGSSEQATELLQLSPESTEFALLTMPAATNSSATLSRRAPARTASFATTPSVNLLIVDRALLDRCDDLQIDADLLRDRSPIDAAPWGIDEALIEMSNYYDVNRLAVYSL
jgi:hypothetical protein